MTIRELIEKLTNEELDKKIDVVAWREAKKGNKNFSSTEQAFLGGAICELKMSDGYEYIIDNIPIPDAGASIRELFKKLSDKELDRDIDDTIAKWREKKSYTGIVFFRLFIQKDDGRSYIKLAKVEMPDKSGKIDPTSKDNEKSKNKYESGYIPVEEDYNNSRRKILRGGNYKVSIGYILDIMQNDLEAVGRVLANNWRTVTENNVKLWSKKNRG